MAEDEAKTRESAGCNVSVTVNNGSSKRIGGGRQAVTITPLPPGYRPPFVTTSFPKTTLLSQAQQLPVATPCGPDRQQRVDNRLDKVLLKAACKGKKDMKTFTLRNVDTTAITSSHHLKDLIKESLHDDISSGNFDVGYMQGTNVIRVRTKDDISEMWSDIRKQRSCTTLWCDGLVEFGSKCSKSNLKRKHASDDESEEELPRSRKKKKAANEDKVQDIVDNLRSKHGPKFTTLQLRIWAELISSGIYTSTDEPPSNNSMFQRAGGESSSKKMPAQGESVVQAFASAITSAVTSATKSASSPANASTSSPAKLIDSRSKLYKQLTELQSLKSAGILTETEYDNEKGTIMDLLNQLRGR